MAASDFDTKHYRGYKYVPSVHAPLGRAFKLWGSEVWCGRIEEYYTWTQWVDAQLAQGVFNEKFDAWLNG